MQKNKIIVGVDISKFHLDVSVYGGKHHIKIQNNSEGFKCLKSFFKSIDLCLENCWFIMEYTGGYEYRLVQFCISRSISFTRIPGLEIKKSLGMQRGKNDKIDSLRIANYGYEKQERLKPQATCSAAIERLKQLLRQRSNFIKQRKAHHNQISELMFMMELKEKDSIIKRYKQSIDFVEKQIEQIERDIQKLISSDKSLAVNFELITSIPGIGPVNAWTTIAYTHNFERFNTGRQFASYCGIAPFENSSGKYKGRSRTSDMCNHEIKANLHMAAKSAVQCQEELKVVYKRMEAAGKHHLSIMNAIMFRLVLRLFAVVNKQQPYVKKLPAAA